MKDQQFIVTEVSKNWDEHHRPTDVDSMTPISKLFEEVILVNAQRGYQLRSWKLDRLLIGGRYTNETIVAVFELELRVERPVG